MHRVLTLSLLLFAINLSAQPKLSLIFQKETQILDEQGIENTTHSEPKLYYLNLTKTVSEYFLVTEGVVDNKEQYIPSGFLYKNLLLNTYTKQVKQDEYVHETLPKLDWILKPESKKILGYAVKKAVLDISPEKQVTAWYSNLTYQNGPENYHRLPGLILEIVETVKLNGTTQVTKLTAISLEMLKDSKQIKDPTEM